MKITCLREVYKQNQNVCPRRWTTTTGTQWYHQLSLSKWLTVRALRLQEVVRRPLLNCQRHLPLLRTLEAGDGLFLVLLRTGSPIPSP